METIFFDVTGSLNLYTLTCLCLCDTKMTMIVDIKFFVENGFLLKIVMNNNQ